MITSCFPYNGSIRYILTLLMGALGSLALLLALFALRNSYEAYSKANLALKHNQMAGLCLAAVKNFAFERGRTNVILNYNQAISQGNREFIDARRASADATMAKILASMDELKLGPTESILSSWDELKRLRKLADRDMALPKAQRDSLLPKQWFDAASQLIEGLDGLLFKVSRIPDPDLQFDALCSLRMLAMRFRNLAGLESSLIVSELAGNNSFRPGKLTEANLLRGRLNEVWEMISRETRIIEAPEIKNAFNKVQDYFFNKYRPLQDAALQRDSTAESSKINAEILASTSVMALDAIIEAVDNVDAVSKAYAENLLKRSFNLLLVTVLAIVAIIVLVIVAVKITAKRVTKPLNEIISRVDLLCYKEETPQQSAKGDEFSKLRHALNMLEQSINLQATDAEKLKQANLKLAELSVTDELTGLANRRNFNETFAKEWSRARRDGNSLAALMIDIDFFKNYNDLYGHQRGDECLIDVAKALRAKLKRPADYAARYGGEEFVVILPDTEIENAKSVAKELCSAESELALPHAGSTYGIVTVSIGVAALMPKGALGSEDLLKFSDTALYNAKNNGRNQTFAYVA